MYKDEQLREAQAWIASVREVDVFQSTTNQTLQTELRERTEQYNQLWTAFQRQVGLLFPFSPLILFFPCINLVFLFIFPFISVACWYFMNIY